MQTAATYLCSNSPMLDPNASWDKDQLGDVLHWIWQVVALARILYGSQEKKNKILITEIEIICKVKKDYKNAAGCSELSKPEMQRRARVWWQQSAISEARLGSRCSTTGTRAQLEDAATFDDSNGCPAWRRSWRSITATLRQMAFDGYGFCLFPISTAAVVMKSWVCVIPVLAFRV